VLSLLAPYLASRAARKNAVLAQRQAEPQDELD
jgi:hypothetical protein